MRNRDWWFEVKLSFLHVMILLSLSGCNSLFYQPQKEMIHRPENFNLTSEDVVIETADGEHLQGWKLPPKANSKGTVVLQFHGNAENRSTHFLSAAWLVMHGVDVVSFDYRGYDGSTGEPSRKGVVQDGIAVVQWLKREYPSHRRIVLGQSLGGAVSIAALGRAELQGLVDGLVVESTFHSYRGLGRLKFSGSWLLWAFQWLPYILLSGDENAIDRAAQIKMPVLAFHDKYDPVVPMESGKILYNELAKTTNLEFVELAEGGHGAAFADPKGIGRKKMLEFLKVD